jgi:protein-glutamine gamma-glutamyltransferase
VIQQGQAGPRLQRKISVAGKDYTPSATYLSWLNANFGPAVKEFVEHMHNGGSPPVYSFGSFDQMGFEVRTRANAIKGIEEVHKGCCDYFDSAHPPHLDSAYWDQVGGGVDFKMKSPLPAGKHPSDAIQAIFAPGAGTRLECWSMTLAIQYYAMLKGIGAAKFDTQFAGGIEISMVPAAAMIIGSGKKYESFAVASKSEILPGDWVYFKNFRDYTTRVPGGYWQGENAISLGGGMYRGFGVAALSENDLNQELVNQYNNGAMPHLSKTVADLIADGGGLWLTPVIRPIISKIAP